MQAPEAETSPRAVRKILEVLYRTYNRREYVHPDPVEFLYAYDGLRDREIAAFVASALAYGRVAQVLKSVSFVLERMNPSPYIFLARTPHDRIHDAFRGFRHRFTTGGDLAGMLCGLKSVVRRHGSLGGCFLPGLSDDHETVLPALRDFAAALARAPGCGYGSLLSSPEKGSALKRLNLFLRWMVRRDEVDPGGWDAVPRAKLIVPLDTHMHRISLALRLTERRQADIRAALEVTAGFRRFSPEDPVKYDFALTRLGIHPGADPETFLSCLKGKKIPRGAKNTPTTHSPRLLSRRAR
ncbi:MAG: TIGR02757 family protein [bacterium]